MYTYLAGHVGRSGDEGAFQALTRGYTHWASGRLDQLTVNINNPKYCHIRATMKPSMKTGVYHVYLLLESDAKGLASILSATCECAAGYVSVQMFVLTAYVGIYLFRKSASCTHVSAALSAIKPTSFQPQPNIPFRMEEEQALPVTSYLCQWKVPKSRKESTIPMSEAVFEKHEYSKQRKRKIKPVEDYDPRPPEFLGSASDRLPALLEEIRGEHLCVSLLFDKKCRHWNAEDEQNMNQPSAHNVPADAALQTTMSAFKESQRISEAKAREIEQGTREQRLSSLWFSARRYRITASNFGRVLSLKRETPPDSLVMHILQPKCFSALATQYGIDNEQLAIEEYVSHQNTHGHPDLTVSVSGFIIDTTHPFLGASPDGAVYDPIDLQKPFGFLEIKCPYSVRNQTPVEACSSPGFYCTVDETSRTMLKYKGKWELVEGHGVTWWCTQKKELV